MSLRSTLTSLVKFRFNSINQPDIHLVYPVLFSRTFSQKTVRGSIIAERIGKPRRDSLERRLTQCSACLKQSSEKFELLFDSDTAICRKTRTSRILSVSVSLRSCDSVHFHDYEAQQANELTCNLCQTRKVGARLRNNSLKRRKVSLD